MTIRATCLSRLIGAFVLALAAVSAPAQNLLQYGFTSAGSIDQAGESDEWRIPASPGDVLLVRAAWVSGDLWPFVHVHGPAGNLISEFESTRLAEKLVTIPAGTDGDVRILVNDGFNGAFTGSYNIWVQRLNLPGNTQPAPFGMTDTGGIPNPGEMDTYTFTAEAGDVIFTRMSNLKDTPSSRIWPMMRIYGLSGNLVADTHRPNSADLTATIPTAGAYTLVVGDGFDGTFVGNYALFTQRLNRPDGAVALDLARRAAADINLPGAMRTYTVALPEGYDSPLAVRLRRSAGNIWPLLRLYGPGGALLKEEYSFSDTLLVADVPGGATYTILAGDGFNGTFTGSNAIGWAFAMADVLRAARAAAGTMEASSLPFERLNVVDTGDSAGVLDLADAVWIARNAAGLQAKS